MNDEFQAAWPEQATMQTNANTSTGTTARAAANLALKQIVTIRLDVDMLNWFKAAGPGYQTRINQILREHMDAQRAPDGAAE
jgi:uncharacterized protein (DUF4415 family)